MHPASEQHIPDGLLAANVLLAENSRQGVPTSTHALHQGFGFVISHTSLEIKGSLYDGDVRSRCTGKERDAESGNDYFGARYYSSNMGRFSSPDPSQLYYADPTNPQSFNLYSYALNNPLKNTDPTGLYCDYGDGSAADNMDPSQFDYHSSQSECETADENGNKGTWINDAETHQDENGNWTDNEGRPENYSMAVNSAPAAQGAPSTGFKIPNFTVQVGVSINLGVFGPLTLTGFSGFLIDSHGHVGGYNGGGGGLSVGAGGSAGLQVSASNGNSICAMGGPFYNASGTAGAGVGGTVDTFVGEGDAPGGVVVGGGGTIGIAGGADASGMYTGTNIHPFGGHQCVDGKLQ